MSLRYPETDSELREIVRAETSYDNTPDELPLSQLETIVERAKARLALETGSEAWYADEGLGFALAAYASMRAKAAVENVPLSDYSIGDEDLSFVDTEPETSQQLNQWAKDVRVGLDASDRDTASGPQPANTSGYIGETFIETDGTREERRY